MKRILCFLLAVLMLSVTLASCGGDGGEETTVKETSTLPEEEETEEPVKESQLAKKDFGGETVKVLQRSDCYKQEWNSEWESVDVLSDALAEKTMFLEDKYNIAFEYYNVGLLESSNIKTNIYAGNQTYDFMSFSPLFIEGFTRDGLLRRMDQIPNLHTEETYWYQNLNSALALDGKQYMLFGASNLSALWVAYGIVFNKTMLENFYAGQVNIYQMVREHKWTVEEMFNLSKDIYADVDNENGISLKDRYGIVYAGGSWYSLFYGSGMRFVTVGEDGNFKCDLTNEKAISLVQKITEVIGDRSYTKQFIATDEDDEWQDFIAGLELFIPESMAITNQCRKNMQDDYGILPNPLLEEGQENYYSEIHPNHASAFAVPVDVSSERFEMIGCVMEDGCYIAEQVQLPAFYVALLKGRIARDPDSVEMLDYLYSNLMLDPGLVYASDLDVTIRSIVESGDPTKTVSSLTLIAGPLETLLKEKSAQLRSIKEYVPEPKQ